MADLNAWVQSQQKRGYTKEQINAYIARKGYAQPTTGLTGQPGKAKAKAFKLPYTLLILAMLAVAGVVLLFLADKFQGTVQSEEQLLPISKYVSNTTGRPVEIYAGTISKISPKSITLASNGRSKDFPISKENPPKFARGVLGNVTSRVELNDLPNVGEEVTLLFLLTSTSGEKYVSGALIKPN